MTTMQTILSDESGQGMTEYAILIGTLALGAVVTLLAIGTRLKNVFSNVQTQLNSVPTS
jgi:Flp pilus assembly pilin Flp